MIIISCCLEYRQGGSDKVYITEVEENQGRYVVNVRYGRRGGSMVAGVKTNQPTTLNVASDIYSKTVKQKLAKGYVVNNSYTSEDTPLATLSAVLDQTLGDDVVRSAQWRGESEASFKTPCVLLNAISENEAVFLLSDDNWVAQEKFDGVRLILSSKGQSVVGYNRKGKPTYVPEELAASIAGTNCVLDGELVGNTYYAFDCIDFDGLEALEFPLLARQSALLDLTLGPAIQVVQCAISPSDKLALWNRLKKQDAEGIVFKRHNAKYTSGRPASGGNYLKHKFYKTASCLVTTINQQRSVGLSLIGRASVISVGNVTIPPNYEVPKLDDIVEVRYLYAFLGGSLYQPTYLGCRTDIALKDCTMEQLVYKKEAKDE